MEGTEDGGPARLDLALLHQRGCELGDGRVRHVGDDRLEKPRHLAVNRRAPTAPTWGWIHPTRTAMASKDPADGCSTNPKQLGRLLVGHPLATDRPNDGLSDTDRHGYAAHASVRSRIRDQGKWIAL